MFSGSGKEATTAKVDMTGEDAITVAALLEYMYTGNLPDGAAPMTGGLPDGAAPILLLPLADRYEIFDCVDDCVDAMEALTPTCPAAVVRALRPYAQDEGNRRLGGACVTSS